MNNQDAYWQGEEGSLYLARNQENKMKCIKFFERTLRTFKDPAEIHSAFELGANDGRNLRALKAMGVGYTGGVEINAEAYAHLATACDLAHEGSALEVQCERQFDLVLTKGFLIHVDPEEVARAFNVMYSYSHKWILIAEYHAPHYEPIVYRGRTDLLWKGPYAETMLRTYSTLTIRDYGFISRLDESPEDDLTWFLLEKS